MVHHEIKDIISLNEKLVFLVGAGISIESPSRLKSAVEIFNLVSHKSSNICKT